MSRDEVKAEGEDAGNDMGPIVKEEEESESELEFDEEKKLTSDWKSFTDTHPKKEEENFDVKSEEEDFAEDEPFGRPKMEVKDERSTQMKDEDGRATTVKPELAAGVVEDDDDEEGDRPDYQHLSAEDRQIEQILDMLFETTARAKKLRKRRADLTGEDRRELEEELADLEGRGAPRPPRPDSDEDLDILAEGEEGEDAEGEPGRQAKRRHAQLAGLTPEERDAFEFFYGTDEEDYDIEGPEDAAKPGPAPLAELLEPAVADQNYLTARDDDIRAKDLPERLYLMQLRQRRTRLDLQTDPNGMARLQEEANYIFHHGGKEGYFHRLWKRQGDAGCEFAKDADAQNHYIRAIKAVLSYLHFQSFEVPFIYQYRKESISPLQIGSRADGSMDWIPHCEDLWFIYNRDVEYWQLQRQANQLREMWQEVVQGDLFARDSGAVEWYFYEDYLKTELHCPQDYDDFMDWLLLHSMAMEADDDTRRRRGAVGRNLYRQAVQSRLDAFVRRQRGFGITPMECADKIETADDRIRLVDNAVDPLTAIEAFVCDKFPTATSALKACKHVMALQLAYEPRVLRQAREIYEESALVLVEATPLGKRAHFMRGSQRYTVKDLRRTPEILHLLEGQDKGLCRVNVRLDPKTGDLERLLALDACFRSDRYDVLAMQWNKVRADISKMVCEELHQKTEKAILAMLRHEAQEQVLTICTEKLREKAFAPPYCATEEVTANVDPETGNVQKSIREVDDGYSPGQYRVLACVYEAQDKNVEFVQLDGHGEVLGNLTWRPVAERTDDGRKRRATQEAQLLDFICDHKPLAIALGTGNIQCRQFHTYLAQYITDLANSEHPRTPDAVIPIEWVPEDIARVFARSARGQAEFPEFTEAQRRAVSIARRLRDPLPEVAALFNSDRDILSLKLHEYQDLVPPEQLETRLEQCLVTVVSSVGVSLNHVLQHKPLQALLPFVPGLGPRKALDLMAQLQAKGIELVVSRQALQAEHGVPQRVWTNCCGFLRVGPPDDSQRYGDLFDPLDVTRVHPESYDLALKLALDARDEQAGPDLTKEQKHRVIQSIMEDPEKWRAPLDELDLEAYAKYLEQRGKLQREETMEDIKRELLAPFDEPRALFTSVKPDELFYCLTGETEKTLLKGTVVVGTFQRRLAQGTLQVRLDNGLTGKVSDKRFAPQQQELASRLRRGDPLTCVISAV
eukprot:EG_transcript_1065